MLAVLPALWAIGHYIYFWLTGQLNNRGSLQENLLDTPIKVRKHEKKDWSLREVMGKLLLTLLFAPLVLIIILIVVSGLYSLFGSLSPL